MLRYVEVVPLGRVTVTQLQLVGVSSPWGGLHPRLQAGKFQKMTEKESLSASS